MKKDMHKQEISTQKLHFSEMTSLVYGISQSFIFPFKNHFLHAEQLVFSWTQLLFPEGSPAPEGKWSFSSTSSFPQPRQSQSGGWIIFSLVSLRRNRTYTWYFVAYIYWFHDVYRNFKHAMRSTSYIVIMKKKKEL